MRALMSGGEPQPHDRSATQLFFFTELANGIKSPPRQTSSRTLEHTVPRLVASSVAASLRERQAFDSNAGLGRLVDREHLPGPGTAVLGS